MTSPEDLEKRYFALVRSNRFDETGKLVIARAWEEASHFRYGLIGREHLLIGLTHLEETHPVREVLDAKGVTKQTARQAVLDAGGFGPKEIGLDREPDKLTAEVVGVLERARDLADRKGYYWVDARHIALALTVETEDLLGLLPELGSLVPMVPSNS